MQRFALSEQPWLYGELPPGEEVDIKVYNAFTGVEEPLVTDACEEVTAFIPEMNLYRWRTTNLVNYPTTFAHYIWIMKAMPSGRWFREELVLGGSLDDVLTIVNAIKAKTDNLPADPASESSVVAIPDDVWDHLRAQILLALCHGAIAIDNTVWNDTNNALEQARVRVYDWAHPESVGTDNDVIATFEINATTEPLGRFSLWLQKRV